MSFLGPKLRIILLVSNSIHYFYEIKHFWHSADFSFKLFLYVIEM